MISRWTRSMSENLGRLRKEMARWMKEVEDPGTIDD